MREIKTSKSPRIGIPPGTPVTFSRESTKPVKITVFEYNEKDCRKVEVKNPEACKDFLRSSGVVWINVDGVHNTSIIERICSIFDIHPLVQEDITNIGQRPKMDEYEKYLYIITKMLYEDNKDKNILIEQVSIILMQNIVISFQERHGDVFDPVRTKLLEDKGFVRKRGSDYLAYALLDAIVDHYFVIIENLEDNMQYLEDSVVEHPDSKDLRKLQKLKSQLIFLRRYLWPLREILSKMASGDTLLIKKKTHPFFRDVYDHTLQVIEILETFQDVVTSLLDIYLSSINNRMNSIMKLLTIISTIFIPLTFITGLYGMNFRYMPELSWKWSYPIVLAVMLLISLGMIRFFKKKKWL